VIDDQLQAEWLTAVPTVLAIQFVVGPYKPEFLKGDTVGVVTPVPGLGLVREGLWNTSAFQVLLVGRDRDHARLKQSAFQIDSALVFGDWPAQVWGTQVTLVDRTGSEPTPVQQDEHQRQAWACTYFAENSP
jgi:hypothetical protein